MLLQFKFLIIFFTLTLTLVEGFFLFPGPIIFPKPKKEEPTTTAKPKPVEKPKHSYPKHGHYGQPIFIPIGYGYGGGYVEATTPAPTTPKKHTYPPHPQGYYAFLPYGYGGGYESEETTEAETAPPTTTTTTTTTEKPKPKHSYHHPPPFIAPPFPFFPGFPGIPVPHHGKNAPPFASHPVISYTPPPGFKEEGPPGPMILNKAPKNAVTPPNFEMLTANPYRPEFEYDGPPEFIKDGNSYPDQYRAPNLKRPNGHPSYNRKPPVVRPTQNKGNPRPPPPVYLPSRKPGGPPRKPSPENAPKFEDTLPELKDISPPPPIYLPPSRKPDGPPPRKQTAKITLENDDSQPESKDLPPSPPIYLPPPHNSSGQKRIEPSKITPANNKAKPGSDDGFPSRIPELYVTPANNNPAPMRPPALPAVYETPARMQMKKMSLTLEPPALPASFEMPSFSFARNIQQQQQHLPPSQNTENVENNVMRNIGSTLNTFKQVEVDNTNISLNNESSDNNNNTSTFQASENSSLDFNKKSNTKTSPILYSTDAPHITMPVSAFPDIIKVPLAYEYEIPSGPLVVYKNDSKIKSSQTLPVSELPTKGIFNTSLSKSTMSPPELPIKYEMPKHDERMSSLDKAGHLTTQAPLSTFSTLEPYVFTRYPANRPPVNIYRPPPMDNKQALGNVPPAQFINTFYLPPTTVAPVTSEEGQESETNTSDQYYDEENQQTSKIADDSFPAFPLREDGPSKLHWNLRDSILNPNIQPTGSESLNKSQIKLIKDAIASRNTTTAKL